MTVYEKNLKYLEKNLKQIYDELQFDDKFDIYIEDDEANGIVKLGEKKCYVHSVYDKFNEMEEMLKDINEQTKTLIIFGVGYGHVFSYIKSNNFNIEHVIVIEPSIKLFKKFLENKKVEDILNFIPKISFIVGKEPSNTAEALEEIVKNSINTHIGFVYNITYRTLFDVYYKKMAIHIVEVIGGMRSNVSTAYTNTYRVLVNTMKNLDIDAFGIKNLSLLFKELPVLIVSPGPSLNKYIGRLEEMKNRAIIIAVGTAVEVLDKNNIKPHFRAAFSPHVDTTIFKELKDYDIPLIYMNNLYFDILPDYSGPKFRMISHSDIFSQYVYNKLGIEFDTVISELSIANIIFEYLCSIGCPKIMLIGQDLAYKENSMYADGAINNIKIDKDTYGIVKEKDVLGNDVYTDSKFLRMRDALVRSMMRNYVDGDRVINLSDGGLEIPNTKYIEFEKQIADMDEIINLEDSITNLIEKENMNKSDNKELIKNFIYEMKEQLEEVKKISQKRVEMLKKVVKMKSDNKSSTKILREYEKINQLEHKMLEIPFYNEVMKHQLDGNYNTTISAFKYEGQDPKKQIDALESILVRVGVELMTYFEIMEVLIEEKINPEFNIESE